MLDCRTMATAAPAFVIDAINGLLEAELNSVFRFINEGSPYVSRATAEVRRPLAELSALSRKHTRELAQLIESLGGSPSPRQHPRTASSAGFASPPWNTRTLPGCAPSWSSGAVESGPNLERRMSRYHSTSKSFYASCRLAQGLPRIGPEPHFVYSSLKSREARVNTS